MQLMEANSSVNINIDVGKFILLMLQKSQEWKEEQIDKDQGARNLKTTTREKQTK